MALVLAGRCSHRRGAMSDRCRHRCHPRMVTSESKTSTATVRVSAFGCPLAVLMFLRVHAFAVVGLPTRVAAILGLCRPTVHRTVAAEVGTASTDIIRVRVHVVIILVVVGCFVALTSAKPPPDTDHSSSRHTGYVIGRSGSRVVQDYVLDMVQSVTDCTENAIVFCCFCNAKSRW